MKTKRKTGAAHKPGKGVSGVLEKRDSVDGTCIEGPRGRLGIALGVSSLERLRSTARPTHWLVPLEDPAVVERAASLPGEVLWLSLRHPSEVLGQLSDGIQGAWVQAGTLVMNFEGGGARADWVRVAQGSWSPNRIAQEVALRWSDGTAGVSAAWPVSMSDNLNLAKVAA